MPQLQNSSAAVFKLRNSLNKSIEELKKTTNLSGKLVTDIHKTWRDHQYKKFKKEYDEGLNVVMMLFKKMNDYDAHLSQLQAKLKAYEEKTLHSAFRK